MHEQGRTLRWLARETGVSRSYVKAVSAGIERGSPRFRAACARVLGMAISDLFHDGVSSASPSSGDTEQGSEYGAGIAVGEEPYAPQEVGSIGIPA